MMKPLDRSLLTSSPQSLAGRTVILHLLPLSINEFAGEGIRFDSFAEYAFQGFLPRPSP
jgi:predicted AAA+ superfamily ATPase